MVGSSWAPDFARLPSEPLRAVRGTVRSLVTAASEHRCSDEGPTCLRTAPLYPL